MRKLDLRKELKEFYGASAKKASIIGVPERKFVAITGGVQLADWLIIRR